MDRILKVFLDTSPLKTGHAVRGIGAYTRSLIDALKKRKGIKLVKEIRNCDIAHYPYFDLFFDTLRVSQNVPTVVTIFDVIPLIYPEQYPPGIRGSLRFLKQKWELKRVSAVITISETSKKDIVRFLDVPQEKIFVTHLAPGEEFKPRKLTIIQRRNIVKRYGFPERFVLYVGDVNYNKNIKGLIKAFSSIVNRNSSIGLVLVGKAFKDRIPETKELLQLIEQLKLKEKVLILGFVPEGDLVALYNLATVYCQPSFYEGFGLPVLEAMACGCPVVAGRTQALVEVAGDGAIFVDPKDYNDIAKGIREVISNSQKRSELIKKGLAHVKKFNWLKIAGETVKIYKNVAQK